MGRIDHCRVGPSAPVAESPRSRSPWRCELHPVASDWPVLIACARFITSSHSAWHDAAWGIFEIRTRSARQDRAVRGAATPIRTKSSTRSNRTHHDGLTARHASACFALGHPRCRTRRPTHRALMTESPLAVGKHAPDACSVPRHAFTMNAGCKRHATDRGMSSSYRHAGAVDHWYVVRTYTPVRLRRLRLHQPAHQSVRTRGSFNPVVVRAQAAVTNSDCGYFSGSCCPTGTIDQLPYL
jgi:hypothetical protein